MLVLSVVFLHVPNHKAAVPLEPELQSHPFYFMTTKFNVVDTPHQHPAISSLARYINQALYFLHGQAAHQSRADLGVSHNAGTPVGNVRGERDGVYVYLRVGRCV